MTDDAFQLTPQDVRTQDFARVIRGYDREGFWTRRADA